MGVKPYDRENQHSQVVGSEKPNPHAIGSGPGSHRGPQREKRHEEKPQSQHERPYIA